MAENKNSIVIYADYIDTFEGLTDEEAGRLIKHFFRYVNDLNPEPPDRIVKIAFDPIKRQLKRDLKKWEETREKRRVIGKKGGEASAAKRSKGNQAEPIGIQDQANQPVNVTDNVNDNVTVFHIADLDLKFENLKKDQIVKRSYEKYNYTLQQWDQLIGDFYQNCLEKQYCEPYTDLVKYLSNFRKTWKPLTQTKQTWNKI